VHKVLEFNCRFGDPEAQVILPLLETDLVDVLVACIDGRLNELDVRWRDEYAACVVVASGGYPVQYERGMVITGIDEAERLADTVVFHAGTRCDDGQLLTSGGRVLGITATAPTLDGALAKAYTGVERVHFDAMHYRTDIGAKGLDR
jgi:phosphoribosylamine--glycine ligase